MSGQGAWIIQKPSVGRYTRDVLRLEERPLPKTPEGSVLVRAVYLSLDPSNLMWLKLLPGWMEDVRVGDVMRGPAVGVVEHSEHQDFERGDLVVGALEWRMHSIISASALTRIRPLPHTPIEAYLSILSHVGRAALIGIKLIGRARAGETVLVSAAAGATGSLACQIALHYGCRVVGIAGGSAKCSVLSSQLGVHQTIDYRSETLETGLRRTVPDGVDVFFDNVGGETLDAALLHLKVGARVAICGAISQYANATATENYRCGNLLQLLMKRASIQGFVVPDFSTRYDELDHELHGLLRYGAIASRTHVLEGLEAAAAGLELLLSGGNHGKLLVRVSDPDARD